MFSITKHFYRNRLFQKSKTVFLPRFYCEEFKKPATRASFRDLQKKQREESEEISIYRTENYSPGEIRYWNERAAIRKEKRANRFPHSVHNTVDLLRFFQNLNSFPSSFEEFVYLLKKRRVRAQLIEQKYLPHRVRALKPDLAAAHFIVGRGGSVKFVGNPKWIGIKEKKSDLPMAYIPGMFIEGIKAENTSLYCEGLANLTNLYYLWYLSFKNLDTVNDWFLDILSQEHYANLKHLDISGCKNVTYRGLSCFYRFEKLEVLEVGGIPDTTEFKLACLMLYEIMPYLDIRGIDLSLPEEIKPAYVEDSDKSSIEK